MEIGILPKKSEAKEMKPKKPVKKSGLKKKRAKKRITTKTQLRAVLLRDLRAGKITLARALEIAERNGVELGIRFRKTK